MKIKVNNIRQINLICENDSDYAILFNLWNEQNGSDKIMTVDIYKNEDGDNPEFALNFNKQ